MKQLWKDTALLEAIAGKCKRLRAAKGISQEVVYEDTGIHIGKIETARYNITISTLSRLCAYYGITLKEFFEELEIPEENSGAAKQELPGRE